MAAVNTGNNLIYLIDAVLLGFMGVSGFFGKRNIDRLKVEIFFPEEIYAKRPFPLKVRVVNEKKFFPSFLLYFAFREEKVLIPFLEKKGVVSFHIKSVFEKRGVQTIDGIYVFSSFPFGFFTRLRRLNVKRDIIVFPEPKKNPALSYEKGPHHLNKGKNNGLPLNEEIISFRDYTFGDPLKLIHWKLSAKTGDLKVKNLAPPLENSIIIDFDNLPIIDIEERLSYVTYAILEAQNRKRPIGLKLNGRFFEPTASKSKILNMLKELALYRGG